MLERLLDWCRLRLGVFEVISDHRREHPGEWARTWRLQTGAGYCYLKTHRGLDEWEREVHAYEQWAHVFDAFAPCLLGVHDTEPRAILISELPGKILEEVQLPAAQERAVWRAAGQALVKLHNLPAGKFFGPCHRDGRSLELSPVVDACAYVQANLEDWLERGSRGGFLTETEQSLADDLRTLIPVFAGEHPTAGHRDYCPANWLVTTEGTWAGVIDFEFAHWDVRASDLARYPNWEWMRRPDLEEAFWEGYGPSSGVTETQRMVQYGLYAVGAIVWGMENSYFGFAEEGRQALRLLAKRLN